MCGGSSVRVSTMVVTRGSDGLIIDGEANIFLSKYGFYVYQIKHWKGKTYLHFWKIDLNWSNSWQKKKKVDFFLSFFLVTV